MKRLQRTLAVAMCMATLASSVGSDFTTVFANTSESNTTESTSESVVIDTESIPESVEDTEAAIPEDSESAEAEQDIEETQPVTGEFYLNFPDVGGQITLYTADSYESIDAKSSEYISSALTIRVDSNDGKAYLTDADGNVSEAALTPEGYCLELTEDVGVILRAELIVDSGYCVDTYRLLTDTGDVIEEFTADELNPLSSLDNGDELPEGSVVYEYDFTVEEGTVVLDVSLEAVPEPETEPETESETIVDETIVDNEGTTNDSETPEETTVTEPESESETVVPESETNESEAEVSEKEITAFGELSEDSHTIYLEEYAEADSQDKGAEYIASLLPETVHVVYSDGSEEDLAASWVAEDEFTSKGFEDYIYKLNTEGYNLAEGLEVPEFTLTFRAYTDEEYEELFNTAGDYASSGSTNSTAFLADDGISTLATPGTYDEAWAQYRVGGHAANSDYVAGAAAGTSYFTLKLNGKTFNAWCAKASYRRPDNGTYQVHEIPCNTKNAQITKALLITEPFYGSHPHDIWHTIGWSQYGNRYDGYLDNNLYWSVHSAISYFFSDDESGSDWIRVGVIKELGEWLYNNWIPQNREIFDATHIYYMCISKTPHKSDDSASYCPSGQQDIIFLSDEYTPEVSNKWFTVNKTFDGRTATEVGYNPEQGGANYGDEAQVTVYTNPECTVLADIYNTSGKKIANSTVRFGKNGWTQWMRVEPGIYYVKETRAPSGWNLSNQVLTIDLREETVGDKYESTSSGYRFGTPINNTPQKGDAWLQKAYASGTSSYVSGNSNYSLAGAVYYMYNTSGGVVGYGVTDSSGYAEITWGTPTRSLNVASTNAEISLLGVESMDSVESGDTVEFSVDVPDGYSLADVKVLDAVSAEEVPVSNDDGTYEFTVPEDGAVITAAGSSLDDELGISTMEAAPGKSYNMDIPLGVYTVREVSPSKGCLLDTNSYACTVNGGAVTHVQQGNTGYVYENVKTVRIQLTKNSSNTSVTNNNPNYSLQGAEYSIYKNSSLTQYVGKITTNASGVATTATLGLGEYWIKETKASQGYALDPTVHYVDARSYSGSETMHTFTTTSNETPLLDPVGAIIKKVDSVTGETAQGSGTLAGAEFMVRYYKVDKNTTRDPALSGVQPSAVWRLKTDNNGIVRLRPDYLVGGVDNNSPFYYQDGVAMIPYGVITIQEVVAPNGYLLNNQVFVVPINGQLNGVTQVTQTTSVPDVNLDIRLLKVQSDANTPIKGAVFEHTKPDGSKETATTDANGVLYFKGLQHGNHVIKEVSAPNGYFINTNEIRFTVNNNNTINITSDSMETDTNGNIVVTVEGDGTLSATVEDKPAPFKLRVHKTNQNNLVLADAEFTLYSDAGCTQKIESIYTDEAGELVFENLIPFRDYYIKETDAPRGYRIPVNSDGSDIVYKIRVESDPAEGDYTFYVNDVAYTGSTGDFHISNKQDGGEVYMHIVNQTMGKLPNTGSNMMVIIVIAGVVLMGGAIVATRFSKSKKKERK